MKEGLVKNSCFTLSSSYLTKASMKASIPLLALTTMDIDFHALVEAQGEHDTIITSPAGWNQYIKPL